MYHCGYPQPQCPNELLQLMNEAVFGVAVPKKLQPCEHVCRTSWRGLGLLPSDSIAGKVGAGLGKQLPPQGMLVSLSCLGSRDLTPSFQTAHSGQTFAIQVHVKPQLFANGGFMQRQSLAGGYQLSRDRSCSYSWSKEAGREVSKLGGINPFSSHS